MMNYYLLISFILFAFVEGNNRLHIVKCPSTFKTVLAKIANNRNARGFALFHPVDSTLTRSERFIFYKAAGDIGKLTASIRPTFNFNARMKTQFAYPLKHMFYCGYWSMCKNNPMEISSILASDNVLFVSVVYGTDLYRFHQRMEYVIKFYDHFKLLQSLPKFLVVTVSRYQKQFQPYSEVLKLIFKKMHLDVEILQVVVHVTEKGERHKSCTHSFAIHQSVNPFSKSYIDKIYNAKHVWFKEKTKNLHRFKLSCGLVANSKAQAKFFIEGKLKINKQSWAFLRIMKTYLFVKTLMTAMNCTFTAIPIDLSKKAIEACDIGIFNPALIVAHKKMCTCEIFIPGKLSDTMHHVLYAPSLYDRSIEFKYDLFVRAVVLLLSTIFAIQISSRLFNFDRNTWWPIMIFSMILNLPNPRQPATNSETSLFCVVILLGFFFASDLISGVTENCLIRETERYIYDIEDIKRNNLTILLPLRLKSYRETTYESILGTSKVIYRTSLDGNDLRDLLYHKNVCIPSNIFTNHLPDEIGSRSRIMIANKVHARKCNVIVSYTSNWYTLRRNFLLFHRIADICWRSGETGVDKNAPWYKHEAYKYCLKSFKQLTERLATANRVECKTVTLSIENLGLAVILLAFGFALALTTLFVECKLYKYCCNIL